MKRPSRGWLVERLRTFARDRRAGVAMLTAVTVPAILFVGLGAVQLNALFTDKCWFFGVRQSDSRRSSRG